ncbi:MAG TPA: 1-acyl-sn-glycerol-3-phosphate acyltransferase [Clostridiaceae bacterium]|jgi:1-acyl-sn-glycerol-3-phosphate acyltransferase|nr:1-acyl-sn-glycerol-3-phosphate acyltransferase [Clostridiaceae bacterium]
MWFLRFLANIIFRVFIRVKVYGEENMPESGPVILASNHVTMLDMFMIGWKIKRKVHWMAKAELFKNKLLAKIITSLGAYPVKRGIRDQSAVKKTLELLEEDKVIGIFPQGTRSKEKNLKAKYGVARFALESQACVLPVAIWGNIKLFGKAYVRFGEPYKIEKTKDSYAKDEYMQIASDILTNIYDLMSVPSNESKKQ